MLFVTLAETNYDVETPEGVAAAVARMLELGLEAACLQADEASPEYFNLDHIGYLRLDGQFYEDPV